MGDPVAEPFEKGAYEASRASKFRYKDKSRRRSSRSKTSTNHESREHRPSKRDRSRDRSESSRKHRRRGKESRSRNPNGEYQEPEHRYRESIYDTIDGQSQGIPDPDAVHPDEAFRESLFDALADDEGAAYWEGVYGQPVHVYSNTKKGPNGKLEQMSDDEYAEYVRSKMWEKTHQHILEEREARERARKKQKERRRELDEEVEKEEAEREKVRQQMQESLKRGEERKKARELEAAWVQYSQKWAHLKELQLPLEEPDMKLQDIIPWPVVSGKWRHVCKEEIEYFFEGSTSWKADTLALLKLERVRWHPDKMQQRFGRELDRETIQNITAVFQVVDKLWNEHRK